MKISAKVAANGRVNVSVNNDDDIYVVVADNDGVHSGYRDPDGPIVMEQYTRVSTKEAMEQRIITMGGRYGNCRIAKLVFED